MTGTRYIDCVTTPSGNFQSSFESALHVFAHNRLLPQDFDVEALVRHMVSPSTSDDGTLILNIQQLNFEFMNCEVSQWRNETITPLRGWWIIVNRLAVAIVTLHENDMGTESLALVRSAFEYAMAICYATKIDVNDVNENVSRRTFDDFARAIHEIGQESTYEALITELRKDFDNSSNAKWISKFDQRLRELGVWSDAYPYYTMLSAFVHPGLAGALSFADFDNQAKVLLSPNSWSRSMVGNPLLWALQSQCWAALAMDQANLGVQSWKKSVENAISGFPFPMADTLFGRNDPTSAE